MKIVIWTIGIIIMLGVLAYVYFTRGTFVAPDQTTVAATAVPTPTPSATPAPTAQPTPTLVAMTPEEVFKKLYGDDPTRTPQATPQGTTVVVSGIVSDKNSDNLEFSVLHNDPIRGGMVFFIHVLFDNKRDISGVKIGETIIVRGKVSSYDYGGAIINKGELIK